MVYINALVKIVLVRPNSPLVYRRNRIPSLVQVNIPYMAETVDSCTTDWYSYCCATVANLLYGSKNTFYSVALESFGLVMQRFAYSVEAMQRLACHAEVIQRLAWHAEVMQRLTCHAEVLQRLAWHAEVMQRLTCHAEVLQRLACHAEVMTTRVFSFLNKVKA